MSNSKTKNSGRQTDRELAVVIEIEWDGISTRVTMNNQTEGKWVDEADAGQTHTRVYACVKMFSHMPLSRFVCVAYMLVSVCVWGLTPL